MPLIATDWAVLLPAAVSTAAAVAAAVFAVVQYVLPRRGFAISAEIDDVLRTNVRFNLKGEKTRAIQDVHLAKQTWWPLRLFKRAVRPITARPDPANPKLPLKVGDKADRLFVFEIFASDRTPRRDDVMVFVRIDHGSFFLVRPRPVEGAFQAPT